MYPRRRSPGYTRGTCCQSAPAAPLLAAGARAARPPRMAVKSAVVTRARANPVQTSHQGAITAQKRPPQGRIGGVKPQVSTGEVFTFALELGERGLAGGLPTG